METIIYVISDMNATLSAANVEIINNLTELYFEDVNNVTYSDLINARKDSLNMAYGYHQYLNSVEFWVLPCLPIGLVVDHNSMAIKEYTETEYKRDILPLWDVIEIEDEY